MERPSKAGLYEGGDFPDVGVHLGVPNETYHGDDTAVSRSQLAKIVKGVPADLQEQEDISDKPAVVKGNLTDDGIYGGAELLAANYLINPGLDGRTNAGKKWKADHADDSRTLITQEQSDTADAMRNALRANALACEYLGINYGGLGAAPDCLWQSSHVRTNPDTGVREKCRPDTLLTDRGICVDLKTTAPKNLGVMEWTRYCENWRMELQPGMYLPLVTETTGVMFDRWIWVVVGNASPFRVECYECPQSAIEKGKADILAAQRLYAACKRAGDWPNSTGELHQIEYRPWALQ